jgi:TnpA family transposase
MTIESHRLSILTAKEIDELYGLPRFTEQDRSLFFDLSAAERAAVDAVRTSSSAIHLVLQCGYFKAKCRFSVYECEAVRDDLRYIVERYFPDRDPSSIKTLSKPTRLEQQRIILRLFDYRLCDRTAKEALERKAQRVAMLSTQPIYILREILQHLSRQRIVVPVYTFLQDLVGRAVTVERRRTAHLLDQALTPEIKQQLEALLQADEGMYRISVLKHEPKDFSYKELRREVQRRQVFRPLHDFARTFLATTGLSSESVKYYASLVHFYTVYKLQRMEAATTRLYLLCFAYHRFRQINDNLVEALIHLVDQYEQDAKLMAREDVLRAQAEACADLEAAGHVLDLFMDTSIPEDATVAALKAKAFALLEPERFPVVSAYMRNIELDQTGFEWAYYAKLSATFKRNLRQLFTDLTFAGRVEDAPLLAAVAFLQDLLRQGKSPRQTKSSAFPTAFIPKRLHRYLFTSASEHGTKKGLDIDRYEFLVYRMLRNALEAGDVFVGDSMEFRRFEDDLISDARWENKDAVLREIGAPILLEPIHETLAAFHETLEAKFKTVNERIDRGENQHIKIRGVGEKRCWTLVYPAEEEPANSPFYSRLPGIGIADLLWFVTERTGFLQSFTHVLDRYVKHEPDPREILAGVVAMGTNMGMRKMAEVSGLSHPSLLTTARNYLRLETLRAANDTIINAVAALPVFHLYDIQNVIHSSSDGQRIETQIDTINARYSSKYFGLKKGVSAYTMVANHMPINSKIIGANEHESHYVFDLLYNNTTDIKPERHSTDTHGANQVNFWLLHVFDYRFAPRYRNLHKKIDGLVGFQHPKHYSEYLIKPARKVLETLIVEEWPNIQRIMASLAQKEVTQATIVRKLSSYARKNKTQKALWELENICRTLYILDFIDDVGLRQNVQKALNRGEAYHRFRRAIAYVNSGKFRVKTETEQQIWNECSRLIANAIIYYNAVVLSRVYEQKQANGDQAAMNILQGISLIAWQHVNLFGKFEFSPMMSQIDIEALAAHYDDPVCWSKILQEQGEDSWHDSP